MGETCNFVQGGTTYSVYCEHNCCGNECCSSSSFDSRAFAIAMAVILGVLLLIALIVLIVYCCLKRSKRGKNKTDWRHKDVALTDVQRRENATRGRGNGFRFLGPLFTTNRLIQTGNPNPEPKDHILWGRAGHWSSYPRSVPQKETKNKGFQLVDSYSQTRYDDSHPAHEPLYTRPSNGTEFKDWRSPSPQSFLLDESTDLQDKGVQTFPRKKKAHDHNKPSKDRHVDRDKQYLPSWTPVAPWRPSAQVKSLSRDPVSQNNDEHELFYHRHNPNSSLGSDPS